MDEKPLFLLERDKTSSYLTDFLSDVYEKDSRHDLVIICENVHLQAHRTVLAAASSFFRYILKDVPYDQLYVTMDYKIQQVQRLLEFIYKGWTKVTAREETEFINILSDFEIGETNSVTVIDKEQSITGDFDDHDHDPSDEMESDVNPINQTKKHKCNICGQVLSTRTGLRMHVLAHKGEKPFICNICQKGFKQASQLKTHQRVHSGEKPYKCEVCSKSFSHAGTLAEHKNLHSSDKPYQCNVCQQSFSHRKALRVHRCGEDSKNKTFPCPFCVRTFSSRRGLAIHKMHQHAETSSEPLLQCDKCTEMFMSELAYEQHILSHVNDS